MRRMLRFPDFKSKAVTLSYDDGVAQDKRLIAIMSKYGLKGTFNVNGGLFGKEPTTDKGRMTLDEALNLYTESGNEVAIHGYKHLSLAEVDIVIRNCACKCEQFIRLIGEVDLENIKNFRLKNLQIKAKISDFELEKESGFISENIKISYVE